MELYGKIMSMQLSSYEYMQQNYFRQQPYNIKRQLC